MVKEVDEIIKLANMLERAIDNEDEEEVDTTVLDIVVVANLIGEKYGED